MAVMASFELPRSSVIAGIVFGALCDLFPIDLVFVGGGLLALLPMIYLCVHPATREFVTSHSEESSAPPVETDG